MIDAGQEVLGVIAQASHIENRGSAGAIYDLAQR